MTTIVFESFSGDMSARTKSGIKSVCNDQHPRPHLALGRNRHDEGILLPEIVSLWKECLVLRPAAECVRNRSDVNAQSAVHRDAKREIRGSINLSKVTCWKKLSVNVNNDPWGFVTTL